MLEVDVERQLGEFLLRAKFTSHACVTALFGRSGAGKTSLVNTIGGLLKPKRGRIAIDGRVLFDANAGINVPPRNRRVGYVFQEGRLFPHLTVYQNLRYGRWFTRTAERYVNVDQVVELLDLGPLLKRRPGALSGGEKQRVALGRALLASPKLLLMDEPLASLDAVRKSDILGYIERLSKGTRIPIVYVSHSIEEVTRLSETLVLMSNGRIVAVGPLPELTSRLDLRPLTGRYEAGAVIEARMLSHDEDSGLTRLIFPGGELRVPGIRMTPNTLVRVHVRARDVAIALRKPTGLSIQNVLYGRIVAINEESGTFAELKLDVGGTPLLARITRQSVQTLALAPGRTVFALIKSIALDRHSLGLPSSGRNHDPNTHGEA